MLTVTLKCSVCSKDFNFAPTSYDIMGLRAMPKRCPACNDERQGRPSICVERICVYSEIVKVGVSAVELLQKMWLMEKEDQHFESTDFQCWSLAVKGGWFGASWQGRIQLFSYIDPQLIVPGSHLHLREMVSKKKAWVKKEDENIRLAWGDVEGKESVVEDSYIVIEPLAGADPKLLLVWAEAHTKTTIKGFGRQYHSHLSGGPTVWEKRVHGECRSGRYGADAALAIVDPSATLVVVHQEDGHTESREVV